MSINIKLSMVCLLLVAIPCLAQNKSGAREYNSMAYLLKRANAKEASLETWQQLADVHFVMGSYTEAANWYGKVLETDVADPDPENMFRYALCLKSFKKYDLSDKWMQKFLKQVKGKDGRAEKFAALPDYLYWINAASGQQEVRPFSGNSTFSDMAPTFYKKGLVFSSDRDTGLVGKYVDVDGSAFQKLYKSEFKEEAGAARVQLLSKRLSSKANESTTAFTKNGDTLYFTRNHFGNGRFKRDKTGYSRLKLYRSVLQNGRWQGAEELPFCGDGYSVAHPTLDAKGDWLYFVSDMPGSLGATDIYRVRLFPDGSFGKPQNMGNQVNTEGRETFPYISDANILYFASDGHPGLGGLDLFATRLDEASEDCILNLGSPVNGPLDDFGLIMDEARQMGYFVSNREGGKGSDDIYGFVQNTPIRIICQGTVTGLVKDKLTGAELAGANVKVVTVKEASLTHGQTGLDGVVNLLARYKKGVYQIVVQKEGYEPQRLPFKMERDNGMVNMTIPLEPLEKGAGRGLDLVTHLDLAPIHFGLNKAQLNPEAQKSLVRIAEYLKSFPKINVEVRAHTDALGSSAYNQKLSVKRARRTVEFLIEHGVGASRLMEKGFGETQLLNDCKRWEKCNEKENKKNRRAEIIVNQ